MGKIIAVVNQKGGVGKTTTAVNLTAALHDLGLRVLLCDFDPQANATSGLGLDKRKCKYSIYDVLINDVPAEDAIVSTPYGDVLPSASDLAGATVELISAQHRESPEKFRSISGSLFPLNPRNVSNGMSNPAFFSGLPQFGQTASGISHPARPTYSLTRGESNSL